MARLIDADALKRQFIDYVRTEPHFHWGDWQNMCINGNEIDEVIANASTVDAAEVVRCKDCWQWSRNVGVADSPNGHCFYHDIEMNGNDFCSYGERRGSGTTQV